MDLVPAEQGRTLNSLDWSNKGEEEKPKIFSRSFCWFQDYVKVNEEGAQISTYLGRALLYSFHHEWNHIYLLYGSHVLSGTRNSALFFSLSFWSYRIGSKALRNFPLRFWLKFFWEGEKLFCLVDFANESDWICQLSPKLFLDFFSN